MYKKSLVLIILLSVLVSVQTQTKKDIWEPFEFLEGKWTGQGEGVSGISRINLEYSFILNGKFLQMKTRSEFKPQEKNPKGEIHEDMGILSYDKSREKFILREFYIENFVIQYVLESISENGNQFTFVSEHIENAPPGTKAKLIFTKGGHDEMEQSFHVAWPGRDLTCYVKNKLKRKNN